jgi:hypothetical protein
MFVCCIFIVEHDHLTSTSLSRQQTMTPMIETREIFLSKVSEIILDDTTEFQCSNEE